MENDWEARQFLHNGIKHIESQWRRYKATGLRINGALLGFELVSTVAGTDRDSERVAARAG